MLEIRILVVEDEEDQQTLFSDAIEDYNNNNENKILADFSKNKETAIDKLKNNKYDAMFLDLMLEGDHSGGTASGNEILTHVLASFNLRIIVYVISGTLSALNDSFNDLFRNPLMRKFNREQSTDEVISELVKVYQTGVTQILGSSGRFEELMNEIFYKHLSSGFDWWLQRDADCKNELFRYAIHHLLEYSDIPNEDSELKSLNPEFYIYPPIKKPLATGDLVKIENKPYIIMSPSCDLTPRGMSNNQPVFNVDIVVLASLIPLEREEFENLGVQYGKKNNGGWASFLTNMRGTSPKSRFHYLPSYLEISESVIDFKQVRSVPIIDILDPDKTVRLATIANPFIRDIQSRFSAYFGRQGQPVGDWTY